MAERSGKITVPTSGKVFFDLTADLPLHERRLSEREIRRHAPVPDLGCWQRFMEGIRFVQALDHLRVRG
jgi:hypothetical protein